MFLLQAKGRGYYNGHTTENQTDYNRTIRGETDRFDTRNYKIKFKRDYNQIKSSFTFNSAEEAQKALDALTEMVNMPKITTDPHTWYMGYHRNAPSHVNCKLITEHDRSAIEKALTKMTIIEENDYMVFKKSNRAGCAWKPQVRESKSDDRICKTCRINLTPDEPYVHIDDVIMCKHCVETMWVELETKYNKHPNAEEIETAWQAEMVTREL